MKKYQLEFESEKGPAYIYLKPISSGEVASTDEIDGELVDLDKNKNPLGIEILSPNNISLAKIMGLIQKLENNKAKR